MEKIFKAIEFVEQRIGYKYKFTPSLKITSGKKHDEDWSRTDEVYTPSKFVRIKIARHTKGKGDVWGVWDDYIYAERSLTRYEDLEDDIVFMLMEECVVLADDESREHDARFKIKELEARIHELENNGTA